MKYPPAFQAYPVETLRELVFEVSGRYSDRVALKSKVDGRYRPLSYDRLRSRVEQVGAGLLRLGLERGDKVCILGANCTEWALSYLGVVCAGLVAVPIDRDLTERETLHILDFSGAKVLIAGAEYLSALALDLEALTSLETVICLDEEGCKNSDYCFSDFSKSERGSIERDDQGFSDWTVRSNDLAAIIFTSGTTGASKGVMLSHGNIVANVVGTSYHVAINERDVLLSVLPLHHTYEATAGFLTALYQGATICYAESLRRIADNLRETQATVMLGVPALFEAMYRRIRAGIEEKGRKKFIVGKGVAALSEKFGINLRRRIFGKIHERVGGHLRLLISGGAAINPEVSKGFRELGVDFIQGYGMTEYSPIIAVNRIKHFKDASVGIPLPGTDVRIVDDEIVVKGPCVMQGYYKNLEATEEVLRDGWLYTGDLGFFDRDGFLHLSGRSKSVIVTSNGKNVYPEEIESLLNRSPYILESLVWGGADTDPSLTEVQAIIVPDTEEFDKEFGAANYDEDQMMEVISRQVRQCNRKLSGFKRIKKFVLRGEEFEKTTTRKIKRYLYTGKTQPLKKR